jgi:hypothetical protein
MTFFLFFSYLGYAQQLLPRDTVLSDLNHLKNLLETTHPDPYTSYGGKVNFNKKIQTIKRNIPEIGLSLFDFYSLTSKFISQLNDGHTFIIQPENPQKDTLNYQLPLKFKITMDCIYIQGTIQENKKRLGAKVITIENITIDSLLQKVRILQPCENIYGAYLNLTKMLGRYTTVKIFFPNIKNELHLTIQYVNGKTESLNIEFLTENQFKQKSWIENTNFHNITPNGKLLDSVFIDKQNKIAYIGWHHSISSTREMVESVRKFSPTYLDVNLNAAYQSMNQQRPANNDSAISKLPSLFEIFGDVLEKMKRNSSTHLIIDLRYNSGGYTPITIPTLYMLFGDRYFEFNPSVEYNRLLSELYLKKINQTLEEFNRNNNSNYQIGDYIFSGFFDQDTTKTVIQRRNQFLDRQKKQGFSTMNRINKLDGKPIYNPQIIVLTSPMTFSAAYHFTWFLWKIGKAKIVGTPSSQAGNAFMETTPFELPKTHLKGSISSSVQLFFPNDFKKGIIQMPDFPMNWELYKKYSFDNNAEILYILDLINDKKL